MKILDGHIHTFDQPADPKKLAFEMSEAGVAGGIIMSQPPASFPELAEPRRFRERIKNLFEWMNAPGLELYPFFWIDPTENDAEEQVKAAVAEGAAGFKIICDHYYPYAPEAMNIYRKISETGRPILFHSGILWDGKASSIYNRPVAFEALADIPGLRFALAHISWPWVDEHIAVYGKLYRLRKKKTETPSEMFVDTTRGTPPIYREDALRKLYMTGYNVADNVFYGSDRIANSFTRSDNEITDMEILRRTGLSDSQISAYFSGNLLRFISGKS